MNLEQEIDNLKQQIKLREIADDGYYISRRRKEDEKALAELLLRLGNPAKKDKNI